MLPTANRLSNPRRGHIPQAGIVLLSDTDGRRYVRTQPTSIPIPDLRPILGEPPLDNIEDRIQVSA